MDGPIINPGLIETNSNFSSFLRFLTNCHAIFSENILLLLKGSTIDGSLQSSSLYLSLSSFEK